VSEAKNVKWKEGKMEIEEVGIKLTMVNWREKDQLRIWDSHAEFGDRRKKLLSPIEVYWVFRVCDG
jgi:hypothetical protein